MTDDSDCAYRIVPHPTFTPPQLAMAPRRTRIVDAVHDMGEGAVVSDDGTRLIAFHKKHLRVVERLTQFHAPGE